jgi:UDP-glucose 4-epimerase
LASIFIEALRRVEKLAGRSINFHKCDITSEAEIDAVFEKYTFWAVIHFAALKVRMRTWLREPNIVWCHPTSLPTHATPIFFQAVGESTKLPLKYYHNNLTGSLNLLRVMEKHGVKNMVFSSSATVYGEPETTPVRESARLGPVTNPYGKTKLFIEEVLRDQCAADLDWNVCLLRYVAGLTSTQLIIQYHVSQG